MKVESIKCRSAKPEGDKLVLVLEGTSFEEIENVLVGKMSCLCTQTTRIKRR